MIKFLFLIFLFSIQIKAQEQLPCNNIANTQKLTDDSITNLAQKISEITLMVSDEDIAIKESIKTFFLSIRKLEKFDEKLTKKFIKTGEGICNDPSRDATFRSEVCMYVSGLNGKMFQANTIFGTSYAKDSFKYITQSMQLDLNNRQAYLDYALALLKVKNSGHQGLAESLLKIKTDDELKKLKPHLIRLKLEEQKALSSIFAN